MLIGIDGNEANVKKRVGVGEYGYQLLKQLFKLQAPDKRFQIYLKRKPLSDLPLETEGWCYQVFGPKKFWTQLALPWRLYRDRDRPDVFFTPTHYGPRFCPVPSVVSIMDLAFLKFPQTFKKKDLVQLRSWGTYSVKKAAKILTISEASKNDIIEHYQVPERKIVVTYPGKREMTTPKKKTMPRAVKKKYQIGGDYILYVGTLQPRKNLERLIEAFGRVRKGGLDLFLVIAGKKGWLYDEIFEKVKEEGLEERVIFTGYVPDEDLPALYQAARCFVLVSLYEGFGIPVLEALSLGCPVVISNVSSLPEVGGEAAIKVDPESVADIARGITEALSLSPQKRQKLIEEGKKQAQKFSWEKCARETLKVLEEAAGEG